MEGSEGLINAFGKVQSQLINYTRVVLVDGHGVFLSVEKKGHKQRNMNSLWMLHRQGGIIPGSSLKKKMQP